MAVTGVGESYVYRENSCRSVKNEKRGSFLGEISGMVKRAEEKTEDSAAQRDRGDSLSVEKMMQEILLKKQELHEKILKGETQQSFQIGASSFTMKEWERFMKSFDEAEENFEEQLKEAMEMKKETAQKASEEQAEEDVAGNKFPMA